MYYLIIGIFILLVVAMVIWAYHTIQYHKKKHDILISMGTVTKHELKSDSYLIVSLGLMVILIVLVNIINP